jgi:hypothetical protein
MKKYGKKSANMYVMLALLAVLFVSLGYLSMQSKEGMTPKKREGLTAKKREGLTAKKREGLTPAGPKKAAAVGTEGFLPKKR